MTLQIRPVDPADPAQERLFTAWLDVAQAAARAEYGDRHTAWAPSEVRAKYRHQRDERRLAWAAVHDDEVVGQLEVVLPVTDNTHRADLSIAVLPSRRRRGVGSALLGVAEQAAVDDGRTVMLAESDIADGHDDPARGFAARHGYHAQLQELRSDLTLPLPDTALDALAADAASRAAGYEVLTSWDGLPDEWLADRAYLSRRMSTDAPAGGVSRDEEEWDAERVRHGYELGRAQGRRIVESVVRHEQTGRLVGFTILAVALHTPDVAYQWDTLVLREHRGHRLGLLLKVANLRALVAGMPGVTRVSTWNAEQNEPMLRVNRAMGFEPVGRLTEWQKG
jgi:GNAT superfamily N-acetyltransferase